MSMSSQPQAGKQSLASNIEQSSQISVKNNYQDFVHKKKEIKFGVLHDIERNGYCFTDGIGTISVELAILSAKVFGQEYASAF